MGFFDIITTTGKLASAHTKTFRNTPQFTDPLWLPVKGSIPKWLNGVLYRIGPGKYNLGPDEKDPQYVIRHAFDGLPLIHRFEVSASRQSIRYNSRMTAEDREKALVQGETPGPFFGHVHSRESSWGRLKGTAARIDSMMLRKSDRRHQSPSSQSVGVTTTPNYPLPQSDNQQEHVLVSKTDANVLQKLHHDTLEPEKIFTYQNYDQALDGNISAAHHQYDPETGEVFNFTIHFGRTPSMTVFSISKTGQVTILAKITHRLLPNGKYTSFNPSYIHSFWLTKDYVVIPESPLIYTNHGLDLVLSGTVVGGLAWQANEPSYLHVISRNKQAGQVVSVPTDPFFTFHTANGFGETDSEGNTTLHLDCCAFASGDVVYAVHSFGAVDERVDTSSKQGAKKEEKLRGLRLDSDGAADYADLVRYSISLPSNENGKNAKVTRRVLAENVEFPRFSPKKTITPYRYVWGCQQTGDNRQDTGLIKVDLTTGETARFALDNCTCSEPVFVPKDMESADAPEDQGALLSFVNVRDTSVDGSSSNCFILILDAANMQELARCYIGKFNATTFHGSFVDMEFQSVSPN